MSVDAFGRPGKGSASVDLSAYLKADGSRTMVTDLNMNNNEITNLATTLNPTDAANKGYCHSKLSSPLTADLNANSKKVTNLATPTVATDAATKACIDTMLPLAGGTMTGNVMMNGNEALQLRLPQQSTRYVTKRT